MVAVGHGDYSCLTKSHSVLRFTKQACKLFNCFFRRTPPRGEPHPKAHGDNDYSRWNWWFWGDKHHFWTPAGPQHFNLSQYKDPQVSWHSFQIQNMWGKTVILIQLRWIERSLEVKLSTIWTDGKAIKQRWEESENRKSQIETRSRCVKK